MRPFGTSKEGKLKMNLINGVAEFVGVMSGSKRGLLSYAAGYCIGQAQGSGTGSWLTLTELQFGLKAVHLLYCSF